LLIVRDTARRGLPGSSVSALGASAGMNSPYASSTTSTPSVASYAARIVSSPTGVPVGLFGAARITMSGRTRSISRTTVSGERRKSSSRAPSTTAVPLVTA
jgi:hypothetical protein